LYIDWLRFRDVQFTSVFPTVLRTQVILGVVTAVAFFLILYINVLLAWRLAPRGLLVVADDALGLPSPEVLETHVRRLALPVPQRTGRRATRKERPVSLDYQPPKRCLIHTRDA